MRPEKALSEKACRELSEGGALALSLGVESASPRLIKLIDKGVTIDDMSAAIKNLHHSGIAAEVMCFTDFPTETADEAKITLAFIEKMHQHIALFICGQFGLCSGSKVAQNPDRYGLRRIWTLQGDELKCGLFYEEKIESKNDNDRQILMERVDMLSRKWRLHDYPWAGALSTAHTLLYYERFGTGIFKRLAGITKYNPPPGKPSFPPSRFDVEKMMEKTYENEALIWEKLIYEIEKVEPRLYRCISGTFSYEPGSRKKFKKPNRYLMKHKI
jgi:hypothetical protein